MDKSKKDEIIKKKERELKLYKKKCKEFQLPHKRRTGRFNLQKKKLALSLLKKQ
jgi:hypothetical protein